MHDVCSNHMLFLDLIFHITFGKSTNYEAPYYAIFYVLYYFLSLKSNIFLAPYVQTPLTDFLGLVLQVILQINTNKHKFIVFYI
jgi:hypothetical protein